MEQIPLKHFTLKEQLLYSISCYSIFLSDKKSTGNHHQEVFSTFL